MHRGSTFAHQKMPFVYNEDGAAPEQPVSSGPPLQSSKQSFASKRIHKLLTDPLLSSSKQSSGANSVSSQPDGVRRRNSINQVLPFLMKQHAKTLLSIQELQDRVASLEDLSFSLQSAMDSSSPKNLNVTTNPWTPNNLKIEDRTAANYSQVVQSSKRSDCGADSDKQDSGLEVDSSHSRNSQTPSASSGGQNLHPINPSPLNHRLNPHQNQADELLDLLDQICERGNHLRDYASTQQHLQQLNSDLAGMGDAHLLKENRELKRLLQKTDDEKKQLKDQIRSYESQLHRLQGERMAYEDKLSAVCFEKRQLESHVRALHVSCVAGIGTAPEKSLTQASGSIANQGPAESSHLGSFHESPSVNDKVSKVLQMENPLELQRQLIEHIMDKEALQERLKKLEATWGKRHQDWKKTEEALQSHVDDLMGERDECISALRKNQVDLRRLRSRLTFLESAIQKFDGGHHEALDQIGEMALPLPPWMQSSSPRLVQSYHNNLAIGLDERKSPHHSLPPRVGVNQAQNTHAIFRNEGPASLLSDQWRRPGSPEDDLMSVHDELNSQIDQICSEFDPLSTKGGPSAGPRQPGLPDYDSLDLSMPLQPTKLHTTLT